MGLLNGSPLCIFGAPITVIELEHKPEHEELEKVCWSDLRKVSRQVFTQLY